MNKSWGNAGIVGVLVFVVVCTLAQVARPDLDWLHDPLSFYLIGAHSAWVQAAYLGLSISIVAVGFGYYQALSDRARSIAPLAFSVCGAIALVVTAWTPTDLHAGLPTPTGSIHNAAAQTTFLCMTVAMLWQSWRLRLDPLWQASFRPFLALAAFCTAALCVHALRWDTPLPRGLGQKMLILSIVSWQAMASYRLRQQAAPAAARLHPSRP